jgi:multidrug transporter EmrE-like cation transporter
MSQTLPIILNLIAALFGAVGQFFYKSGAAKMKTVPIYQNGSIFFGVLCFCVVMVLFVVAYRLGGKISVVYPIYASTFIWGTLLEMIIDKQTLSLPQWIGTGLVILGISMIAVFSKPMG